ncbi:MAG: sigma 54-interacting transcriptional regulator [Victivallis sp.]
MKLLRLLQNRRFQRLGENERHFAGKIIAATNRDLAGASPRGRVPAALTTGFAAT